MVFMSHPNTSRVCVCVCVSVSFTGVLTNKKYLANSVKSHEHQEEPNSRIVSEDAPEEMTEEQQT